MKYRFSYRALIAMETAIERLQETPEVRRLYDKLHKAAHAFIFIPKVDLSPEELALIKQGLGESNGTIGQWGYEARKELAQLGI